MGESLHYANWILSEIYGQCDNLENESSYSSYYDYSYDSNSCNGNAAKPNIVEVIYSLTNAGSDNFELEEYLKSDRKHLESFQTDSTFPRTSVVQKTKWNFPILLSWI